MNEQELLDIIQDEIRSSTILTKALGKDISATVRRGMRDDLRKAHESKFLMTENQARKSIRSAIAQVIDPGNIQKRDRQSDAVAMIGDMLVNRKRR